jgi:hypothetical protein
MCRWHDPPARDGICHGGTGAGAASTRRDAVQLLQRFQAKSALQPRREPALVARIGLLLRREGQSMRWKISRQNHHHSGHDPRQIDLVAIAALLIVIVAAFRFYSGNTDAPSTSAFIVPSQSVHW